MFDGLRNVIVDTSVRLSFFDTYYVQDSMVYLLEKVYIH